MSCTLSLALDIRSIFGVRSCIALPQKALRSSSVSSRSRRPRKPTIITPSVRRAFNPLKMQLVQELIAFIYTWGTLSDSLRALAHAVGFGLASRGTPMSSQHSTVDGTARRPRRISYESQREGAEYGPSTRKRHC